MSRPTVGQALAYNEKGWTGVAPRVAPGASWVQEAGFAHEDWNFALDQAVDGFIYGYGQGRISTTRLKRSGLNFDVLFYHYDKEQQTYVAVGLYINARYLDGDEREEAWQHVQEAGLAKQRRADIRRAFKALTASQIKKKLEYYEQGQDYLPIRWKVRIEDVIVFPQHIRFVPGPSTGTYYRQVNAYDWTKHPWTTLNLSAAAPKGDPEGLSTHEGTLVTVTHQVRERDPLFRTLVVKARKSRLTPGQRLTCEACAFDFGHVYGTEMDHFVEAHHSIPLSQFRETGGKVEAKDIVFLCANCHRTAHRTGRWTVQALKELLKTP